MNEEKNNEQGNQIDNFQITKYKSPQKSFRLQSLQLQTRNDIKNTLFSFQFADSINNQKNKQVSNNKSLQNIDGENQFQNLEPKNQHFTKSSQSILISSSVTTTELTPKNGEEQEIKYRIFKQRIKSVQSQLFNYQPSLTIEEEEQHIQMIGSFNQIYLELETLGQGCSCIVKKVQRICDGEIFAAKIIRTDDEEKIEQIKNEFIHMLKLSKNIFVIQHLELLFCKEKGTSYCIMEYFEGKSIFDCIYEFESGGFPEDVAKNVFLQTLKAIKFLHSRGVCHRDIKPDNILINKFNQIKLIDFNISKFMDISQFPIQQKFKIPMTTSTGSLEYMAPEMFECNGYNESIDIWSAGITLYFMISGQVPFKSEYRSTLVHQIQSDPVCFNIQPFGHLSLELQNMILSLLQKQNTDRISIDDALLHPWFTSKQMHSQSHKSKRTNEINLKLHGKNNLLSRSTVLSPILSEDNSILQNNNQKKNEELHMMINQRIQIQIQLDDKQKIIKNNFTKIQKRHYSETDVQKQQEKFNTVQFFSDQNLKVKQQLKGQKQIFYGPVEIIQYQVEIDQEVNYLNQNHQKQFIPNQINSKQEKQLSTALNFPSIYYFKM